MSYVVELLQGHVYTAHPYHCSVYFYIENVYLFYPKKPWWDWKAIGENYKHQSTTYTRAKL